MARDWSTLEDRLAVGERLRELEAAEGLTGVEVALAIEVSAKTYNSWKDGKAWLPAGVAVLLKKKLGCGLEWLYLGEEATNSVAFQQRLRDALKGGPPHRGSGRRARKNAL